ncbi:MAG: type IV-A pilus assembly ATPase PilB [Gammaproteobacteria bacterium RIFCSPHIGHO2_12_FULL_41_20]|nr:MAG: type IV-A pilus assembly ATPase PilB [Gammaproteobacteria bacterium RIFCSPHIGHO2_12_FULL_41_20]
MGEPSAKNVLSGYAYYLAEEQLLDKQTALNALQQAHQNKQSYIDFLLKQKLLDEAQVARTTAEYFGLPLCDINAFNANLMPSEYLNIQLVKKHVALPLFKKNGILYMAILDPTIENLYEIKFLTGFDIRLFIVEASKLDKVISDLLNTLMLSEISQSVTITKNIEINTYKEEDVDLATYDVESAPIINYVNKVLLDAINKNASDIHFEHYEDNYRIRYRQDGILYAIPSPPLKLANYLLARIKVMSDLDITEHRIPQDGRFKLILSKTRAVDVRVSVCPTIFGEKIALRILDTSRTLQSIDNIGMEPIQQEHFRNSLKHSQGMILVTGPTGSGKTVTLYSALHSLNSPEKNISTVEDPVEIPVHGINQVHVNPKTGLTFATVLRSFLRQDPDIIMVGEIRDLETADIAVKASQTGHLVLSTLHTNSAPETVTRLISMGIEPYNLASSLTIVIAQRLVRVLCDECKVKDPIPEEVLIQEGFKKSELSNLQLYKAVGCKRCIHGFNGRVGIFEVLPITTTMAELIMRGGNAIEITNQARKEGVNDLRESGLNKVKNGITTLAELNRVFK